MTITTVALALAVVVAPAGTAQAATGPHYVALGDSVSSGEGAPPFDPAGGDCDRSAKGYPTLFARQRHVASFAFPACSGATTTDVLSTQLTTLNLGTDLVTLTVGANDVGFSPIVQTCTVSPNDADCDNMVHRGEAKAVTVLPLLLAKTYAAVRLKAPRARVVVLGYERLFEPGAGCANPYAPNLHRRTELNRGADVLDGVVAAAARAAGFSYVDVRGAFAGHALCAKDSWINGPEFGYMAYHPNAYGYAHGYLPPLLAAAPGRPLPSLPLPHA